MQNRQLVDFLKPFFTIQFIKEVKLECNYMTEAKTSKYPPDVRENKINIRDEID